MLVIALAENDGRHGDGNDGNDGKRKQSISFSSRSNGNFCRTKMHGFLWEDLFGMNFWVEEFHHGLLGGKNRRCNLHALNQLRWDFDGSNTESNSASIGFDYLFFMVWTRKSTGPLF